MKSTCASGQRSCSEPYRKRIWNTGRTIWIFHSEVLRHFSLTSFAFTRQRDLVAAGIPKVDESNKHLHLHAMRHSTGMHLSAAVEKLPTLRISGATQENSVAPTVAPDSDILSRFRPIRNKPANDDGVIRTRKNPGKRSGSRGFFESGRLDSN